MERIERNRLCIHEAAHAVAAVEFRLGLHYCTVKPDGAWTLGHVSHRMTTRQQAYVSLGADYFPGDWRFRSFIERATMLCLAGNVAEEVLLGCETPQKKDLLNREEVSDEEFARFVAKTRKHGWPPTSDEEDAVILARALARRDATAIRAESAEEIEMFVAWTRARTRTWCRDPRVQASIQALAEELTQHERIGAPRVRELLGQLGRS